LRIGQIGPENLNDLNVNHFTALEVLQVCIDSAPPPEKACNSWAMTTLKRLVIECSYNDSQHGVVPFFHEATSEWLKDFAKLAVARRQNGNAALVEMEILYYNDHEWSEIHKGTMKLQEDTRQYIEELGLACIVSYTNRYSKYELFPEFGSTQ
jgi:hypothetical protein